MKIPPFLFQCLNAKVDLTEPVILKRAIPATFWNESWAKYILLSQNLKKIFISFTKRPI